MQRKTILLTGASGFLGKRVLNYALTAGHEVVSFGRSTPKVENPRHQFVSGDLTSLPSAHIPWEKIDAVIHLAAGGVKSASRTWSDALETNVVGTCRLLQVLQSRAVRLPVVFHARTFYEHLLPAAPGLRDNPYIATKAASAEVVKTWAKSYQGPVVLGTLFQIYGPGDAPGNVLSYAARNLLAGQVATFGSGLIRRDWLHIDDAARGVLAAIFGQRRGVHEFDVGSGQLTGLRDILSQLAELAGVAPEKAYVFDPTNDRPDVETTLAADRPPAGWAPQMGLSDGLRSLLY